MKKLVVGGVFVVVGVAALVVGCPRGEKAPDPVPAPTAAVDSAATGTVLVRARFVGTPPAPKKLPREADSFCGKTKMLSEELLVRDGAIENVVVRVVGGTVPATTAAAVPPEERTVDQVNCMYRPRVQVASAGAKLVIRNSDPVAHNVHPEAGERTLFNRQMLNAGSFTKTVKELGVEEGVIAFGCDIHPWMNGFVVVSPHRAAAVTGSNGEGRFEVLAGTHVVEAWHETLGTTEQTVVVEAGKVAEVDVELGAP